MCESNLKTGESKTSRLLNLSKEGSWIIAGQVAAVTGSLVLVRVLTEFLDPIQYGQLALGLTFAALVNKVIMGGIGNGIGRFYSLAVEHGDLHGYLRATQWLLGVSTLCVAAIALPVLFSLLLSDKHEWVGLVSVVLFYSVLQGINSSLNGIQNAARQRPIVALHNGIDAWLKIGMAVGIMLCLGRSNVAVVSGYIGSAFAVSLSQVYFLRRLLKKDWIQNRKQPI